ncbi:MAG: exo-alpha-sialidase, partial [Acidobacteria bacterium]|nr:exo-alpha-sialidase [Acidobacteriota bacterium]
MLPNRRLLLGGALAVAGAAVLFQGHRDDTAFAAPDPQARSAFKITFGLRNRFPNVAWPGGFRNPAQIRSLSGWRLDTSDAIRPPAQWDITLRSAGRDILPKGVIVDLLSPEEQPVAFFTRQGDFTFTPAEIPAGVVYYVPGANQDMSIERVPVAQKATSEAYEDDDPALLRARDGTLWLAWVGYRTRARDGFFYQGADEVFVSRSHDGRSWPMPVNLTPPGDHFRVALGQDRQGRIWCIYGAQKNMESGNFDLYARVYDGERWSREQPLTSHPLPDIFHRLASDAQGNLYLVWMGYRAPAAGGAPRSDILMRVLTAQGWTEELRVTDTAEDDWEPAVSVASNGQAWIAWDAYRSATGYDLMLRDYRNGQLGPAQAVSETALAEMRADVAVDGSGRVWVAWEEGPANWGKDTGYSNPKIGARVRKGGTLLYGPNDTPTAFYRRPRLAVLEGGQWRQPQASFDKAYPPFLPAYLFQNPRLG